MRLGRDQRHVGVAREQALDLLEPHVAAADDQAATALEPQAGDVERRLEHVLHAGLIADPLAELADALLAAVGLGGHRYKGTCAQSSSRPQSRAPRAPDRVARQPRAELQQRPDPVAQRAGADRRAAVQDRRRLAQRLAERLVVRVPPGVADRRGLPHAQLDVHALVQAELRVRAAEAGVLDAAPRALAGAVAEHVVVDPDHARPRARGRSARPCCGRRSRPRRRGRTRESLASATASSSESTTTIGSTGPKISSRMIRISWVTPVRTVGRVERAVLEPAGRLDRAAAAQRRARGDGVVDQLAHELELLARDHRADLGVPADRVADAQALRAGDDAGDEPLGHLAHHVDPLDPRARLAGVGEPAPQRAGDRVVEVRVRRARSSGPCRRARAPSPSAGARTPRRRRGRSRPSR